MSYSITPESEESAVNSVEYDPVKLEQLMNDIKSKQSLPLAMVGGITASVVGAILWAVITYITGYQIGFMAIGVGFLVGYAVNYFGKGMTTPFGIVGALFALFGCILGNLFTTIIAAYNLEGVSFFQIIMTFLTSPGVVLEIMKETFRPMDLLFYGIAVYEGYRFSFRQISKEEMASLQKTPVSTQPDQPVEKETQEEISR
jgi:hypothetical protein